MRERLTDMIAFSFVRQEAAAGDRLDFAVRRIDERFVILIESARTGLVKFAGALLIERLVGPVVIVDINGSVHTIDSIGSFG